jgi:hypothetical protein
VKAAVRPWLRRLGPPNRWSTDPGLGLTQCHVAHGGWRGRGRWEPRMAWAGSAAMRAAAGPGDSDVAVTVTGTVMMMM